MKIIKSVFTFMTIFFLISCLGFSKKEEVRKATFIQTKETKVAYFASGCFWCVEAIFESVKGVEEAVSGYAGGHTLNPTYKLIGTGNTGHSETVAVYYNPTKVSFETLVTVYFGSHDPTTVNGQHPDYGSQYRSIAFYSNDKEKNIIENTISKLNKDIYKGKIATEVIQHTKFYEAEEYHQDFERRNPNQGYVKAVSVPRLNKFKKKFPELLKKNGH
ncbi:MULTISPECIES: peptide-methionine (S)-S-oxide reductase MsrA [unclassified Polaribacter]|jgi:peptide-methionine (S)-S-oxide reductase|uniref:peptide-methionine (S)-S-oxide reductase MsrA n=1 Tax=unclassified Polaribacter TaxID=196858 RepID=UPI00052C5717|nr:MULTISPECIES: peptide-methionine (S)-S-oxide reductase MsrA [unclassified Polaribacter]MBT3740675.1 peptide-methionine (S)-S-oxide reductase MsrA [Polaribacter sp.]KGL60824.1 peptide methionine sulfoxide reductase MsrA [Polaribacter sp. Hel1_33_49]MDG1195919.1 peptide-methionine (S)-S-oxide reductase MsrA [Polaribacter sp.]MDG2437398.1 peptide-methionine (S)-S-oxide reductase MsrA [Polaribacter sp.]PKV64886.1 peptide-methionine (S)-S-oxide reductase [Polaribacter sp. Hel1_33_96]